MRAVSAMAAAFGISLFATAAVAQEAEAEATAGAAPVTAPAVAEEAAPGSTFAKQFTFVLGVERLLGLSFTNDKEENQTPPEETELRTTEFGFSSKLQNTRNPYFLPQIGADVFVIDSLSVGLGLSYWHSSGEEEVNPRPDPADPPLQELSSWTLFRFTPRVGFGMMFNNYIGLWARGGPSYYSLFEEEDDGDEITEHGWAVSVEGMLLISPVNHFGIGIGPVIDIGLTGKRERDPADPNDQNTSVDVRRNQYGALAGLMFWF